MDEKGFQKIVDKFRQEIVDLQNKFNSDISKILINLNKFKMVEDEKQLWPINEDFHQLQDFTLEEIMNINHNLKLNSIETKFKYSAVAKLCGYVDLPVGWYKCESNWFSDNKRGICIKYDELIASVASCQPMNNTRYDNFNQVLDSELVANVLNIDESGNKICYLYSKQIIYK